MLFLRFWEVHTVLWPLLWPRRLDSTVLFLPFFEVFGSPKCFFWVVAPIILCDTNAVDDGKF